MYEGNVKDLYWEEKGEQEWEKMSECMKKIEKEKWWQQLLFNLYRQGEEIDSRLVNLFFLHQLWSKQ